MSRCVHTVGAGAVSTRHVIVSPIAAYSPATIAAEGNPNGAETSDKPSAALSSIPPDRESEAA